MQFYYDLIYFLDLLKFDFLPTGVFSKEGVASMTSLATGVGVVLIASIWIRG